MSDTSRIVDFVLAVVFFFLGYVWYSLAEGLHGLMAVGTGMAWLFNAVFWHSDMFDELEVDLKKRMFALDVAALVAGLVVGYVVYGIPGAQYGVFIGLTSTNVISAVYFLFFAEYPSVA